METIKSGEEGNSYYCGNLEVLAYDLESINTSSGWLNEIHNIDSTDGNDIPSSYLSPKDIRSQSGKKIAGLVSKIEYWEQNPNTGYVATYSYPPNYSFISKQEARSIGYIFSYGGEKDAVRWLFQMSAGMPEGSWAKAKVG